MGDVSLLYSFLDNKSTYNVFLNHIFTRNITNNIKNTADNVL